MKGVSMFVVLTFLSLASALYIVDNNHPPHCTVVTKNTDFTASFRYAYQDVIMAPGQQEVFQRLRCVHPSTVSQTVTKVCDWAAPPLVQITINDEYIYVLRQDPTGRFANNAVISTGQKCSHNSLPASANHTITRIAG